MEKIDFNADGFIEYSEFAIATQNWTQLLECEEIIKNLAEALKVNQTLSILYISNENIRETEEVIKKIKILTDVLRENKILTILYFDENVSM